jgi:hypothetical protein
MRKTACLACAITPPATGVDKHDNLPIGITDTLHMPQLIMVFTSFDDFILPLEKTLPNFFPKMFSFLCMKNYHLNPQTTYV